MPEEPVTIVVVEDHEITRLGLKRVLQHLPDVTIVGEATDGRSAVDKAIELCPNLMLMDIGLPVMDGIEATRLIKGALPTKVIMITSHENDEDIFAGLSAGADGYCLKGISGKQLAVAIQAVMDGAVWLDPRIAKQEKQAMSREMTPAAPAGATTLSDNSFQLSERESEVLAALVDGLTNQQIAERLFLSPETVKTHMRHLMEKLRVSDRTQAAVKALKHGWGKSAHEPQSPEH